jgi:hypothetical protein
LWRIIHGVKGIFNEQLIEIKNKNEKDTDDTDLKEYYSRMKNEAVEGLFYSRFKIPVFESFKFAPGDRFANTPVGRGISWKETGYNVGREDFIKFALNKWIDVYFPKK